MPHTLVVTETPAPAPHAEGPCRNCGAPLDGPYCSQCGQEAQDHLPSVREMAAELINNLFGFDSKLVRTIGPLFLRPGFVTVEYIVGRRVRYVPPWRLYLVASFLLFFAISLTETETSLFVRVGPEEAAAADTTLATEPAEDAPVVVGLDAPQVDSLATRNVVLGRLEQGLTRMQEDPKAFTSRVLDRVPVMMFFLLPVFALLLQLLYVRSGRPYVAHFIFSLHFHAYFFLSLAILQLAGGVGGRRVDDLVDPLIFGLSIVYLYAALRRVYGQSRRKTVAKGLLLLFTYPVIGGIAFLIVLAATLLLT